MKSSLAYLKTGNFAEILQSAHDEIIGNLKLQNQRAQAEQIEAILREIKQTAKLLDGRTTSATVNYVNNEVVNLINEIFQQQQHLHERLKSPAQIFYRSHATAHIKGTDDIFEEQLAFLLKAAGQMKGFQVNIPYILGGQDPVTSASIQTASQKITQKAQELIVNAAKNYNVSVRQQDKLSGKVITEKAGKIDINSPCFEIEASADDFISRLLKAFSGKTFSVKNYSSYNAQHLSDVGIHLGNTNLYKAITIPLSTILSDPRGQRSIFYRGLEYLADNTKAPDTTTEQNVERHFAHLRFIYELRGQGLVDINNNNKIVDFIIWNDPSSTSIAVRSTKDLILQYIDQYTNPFSEIAIGGQKFISY